MKKAERVEAPRLKAWATQAPPVDSVHYRQLVVQGWKNFQRLTELHALAGQLRMLERLMPAARAADADIYGGEVTRGPGRGLGLLIEESYAANGGRRSGVSRNEILARVFVEQGAREVERRKLDRSSYLQVLVKGRLRIALLVVPTVYSERGAVRL